MDVTATEPRLTTERHDVVLILALGALATARRLEEALTRTSPGSEVLDPTDPVVVAALGALACGRSLRRWLEEALDGDAELTPPAPHVSVSSRELLR